MGLLGSGLTHSNLPLTDARVFYEINRKPWTGRALAEYLGLDEGYVSRIVSRLEKNGWGMRAVSKTDRRRRELIPTDEGKAKLPEMVGWIRARTHDVLGDVPGINARHTDEAIGRLRHHLAPEELAEAPVIFRDLPPGETGWITNRFAEFARDAGYNKMSLWTMSPLLPAIKLYERAGFVCVAKKVETNFGQTVENQTWELVL